MPKLPIDPFSRKPVSLDGEILKPDPRDIEKPEISYLQKLRLNLVVSLGSPWRVKYDLIERNIAILNLIETDPKKLHDSRWIYVYDKISATTQRELEKLDKVWKDMSTKRSSQDQLRAFQNIEIFIEFLTEVGADVESEDYADDLIHKFIMFLKKKDLYIDKKKN